MPDPDQTTQNAASDRGLQCSRTELSMNEQQSQPSIGIGIIQVIRMENLIFRQ